MEHLQCSINSCGEGIKGQGEGLLCGMYLAINKMWYSDRKKKLKTKHQLKKGTLIIFEWWYNTEKKKKNDFLFNIVLI